jgi:hypothetical protein
MPRRRRLLRRVSWLAATLLAGALAAGPAAASLTGVCPDGSMFIVKKEADVPCPDAKLVAPHEMPPIRPTHLPRPYAWEVFQRKQDPNNPYNMVDTARQVREGEMSPEDAAGPETAPGPQSPPTQHSATTAPVATATPTQPLPPVSAASPPSRPLELSPEERRDLALIVELSQQRVPVGFAQPSETSPALRVRLAHSQAFQARVHASRGGPAAGPVVLFRAEAVAPGAFYANFTFAQGHTAFHPNPEAAHQLGVIEGSLGPLAAGQSVLGYVVLPAHLDVAQSMDVYWNDHRLVATLRP